MARYGRIVDDPARLRAGDLVFFTRTYRSRDYITHVGLSLGGMRFIHTSNYQGVRVSSLEDPYWMGHYIFGTRVFREPENA
jgi:cell wall-associated NlpC family hydrolase